MIFLYTAINCLVLLPLCLFIFFLGFQRWRQQTACVTENTSDLLTFHQLATEVMSIIGWLASCCGFYTHLQEVMMVGLYLSTFGMQMSFHLLACIERYLAVVHPITYLRLKQRRWILIRNACICYAWLNSFGVSIVMFLETSIYVSVCVLCVLALIVAIVFFCSLSVLGVLIRSRPGDSSGRRQHVEKSKLRAFYTILSIMTALIFKLGAYILVTSIDASPQFAETTRCGILLSGFWFSLPSALVLPLLFLQRAGKLRCCSESKQ